MEDQKDLLGSKSVKSADLNMLFRSRVSGHEPHEHKFYELEVTLLGDGIQTINGTSYSMRRGEVHVMRHGDVHTVHVEGAVKTFLIQFSSKHMSADMVAEFNKSDKALITYLGNDECDVFENICNALDLLKSSKSGEDSEMVCKLFGLLLDMFYCSFSGRKKLKASLHDSQDRIQQILDWLHMHYRTHINTDDVAKHFHFNTAYLRRLFKERVGVSLMQYLKELRLEYAKNLLLTTGLKISEVCDRSGYRSMPTFINDFKQKYQYAPLAFREKYTGDGE